MTILFFIWKYQKKEKVNGGSASNATKENKKGEVMTNQEIKLIVNDYELAATLNDNSSSKALVEELRKGSITIEMSDYANMEKVGDLGISLPKNDKEISTSAGDLILYQGNNFVIYYDTNRWILTKLGKINNVSSQELKSILGQGDITVQISLN